MLVLDQAGGPAVVHEYGDEVLANTMVDPETLVVTEDGVVLVGGLRSGTLRGIPEG